jgi:hypothetical protein
MGSSNAPNLVGLLIQFVQTKYQREVWLYQHADFINLNSLVSIERSTFKSRVIITREDDSIAFLTE